MVKQDASVTKRQQELVDTLVRSGQSVSTVAKELGWSRGGAYEALRKEHVRLYLLSQIEASCLLGGTQAVHTMRSLLSARSEKVRFEASKDLLDRIGARAPEQTKITSDVSIHIDLS